MTRNQRLWRGTRWEHKGENEFQSKHKNKMNLIQDGDLSKVNEQNKKQLTLVKHYHSKGHLEHCLQQWNIDTIGPRFSWKKIKETLTMNAFDILADSEITVPQKAETQMTMTTKEILKHLPCAAIWTLTSHDTPAPDRTCGAIPLENSSSWRFFQPFCSS